MCIYTERIRARLIAGADFSIQLEGFGPQVLALLVLLFGDDSGPAGVATRRPAGPQALELRRQAGL